MFVNASEMRGEPAEEKPIKAHKSLLRTEWEDSLKSPYMFLAT